jgi:AcrR family transcriptional regulator
VSEPDKMRRKPTQQRGEQRVQQILDATEKLALEVGTDAISTNHVARRAGVNVGAVYHFFTDKFEIFGAVIGRMISALDEEVREVMSKPVASDVEWLEGLIDVHERFWFEHKAAIRLWLDVTRIPEMQSLWDEYYAKRLPEYARGLKEHFPHISASRRPMVTRMLHDMMVLLLDEAIIEVEAKRERAAILRETRFILRGYVCKGGAEADPGSGSRRRG